MTTYKNLFAAALFFILLSFVTLPHLIWIPDLINSWLTSEGLVYYKDFVSPHFPLAPWLALPFYLVSDWNLETGPFLSLLVGASSTYILYTICLKDFSKWITALVLFFFVLLYWYFATAVQYSQEALAGLLLIATTKNLLDKKHHFTTGILLAASVLAGQITGLTVALAGLLILFRSNHKQKKALILGGFIPVVLVSVYFLTNNALYDFYFWNVPYYFIYRDLAGNQLQNLPWRDIAIFYSPLIFLTIGGLKKHMILILLLASTVPTTLFSIFHPHHFLYGLPIAALSLGYGLKEIKKRKLINVTTLVTLTLYFVVYIFPWYADKITVPKSVGLANDTRPGDPMDNSVNWIRNITGPDTTILVAGDPLFYFKADRLPANNRLHTLPWHYIPLEPTAQVINSNLPDYWIIDRRYMGRFENGWNSPEVSEYINKKLFECFQKVNNFENWEIWEKVCSS